MFVIVYNNNVILGPMKWNRYRFENEIQEECDVQYSLPDRNDSLEVITVNDNIKIYPVEGSPNPEYNPKIQFLNGPYWTYTDTAAISSYVAENLPIDAVKNMLKEQVGAERWKKENAGTVVNINGTDYNFATDRDTRALLASSTSLETINWKMDRETWIAMTGADVQSALNTILSHVQSCFDWELSKLQAIDACTSLEELDAFVIIDEEQE